LVYLVVLVPFDVEAWLRLVREVHRQLRLLQGCSENRFDHVLGFLFVAFV